jgi:hypothetical protein
MGLVALILKIAIGAVLLVGVAGGVAYAMDMGIDADVTNTQCNAGSSGGFFGGASDPMTSTVTVKTRILGIGYTVTGMGYTECQAVHTGYFVRFHIRSQRTSVWDAADGNCIYDSVKVPHTGPAACNG